ncbi:dnaJ homolog subfamily C member 16-like [Antedon mediterranea]|uniref:dnaJ homolog subfamily C member 16-like n=1 Tax=Antedon mediterranea TaxID=105859 RepID=UPI003AF70A47
MARLSLTFLHLALYQVLFVGLELRTDERQSSSTIAAAEETPNPYNVLGVRRTASLKDIKRAYKSLAREWHPDKNDDPDAENKFVAISKAYEILSDEEKRRQYDDHGYVDDRQQAQQHHNPFQGFNGFSNGFNFKFDFSGGGHRRQQNKNSPRIKYHMFHDTVLPESRKKVYMFLVTGQMCFHCYRVEGIWEENVHELQKAGVGIGTVYGDHDRQLVRALGVNSYPSIVGVIDETIYHFGSQTVIDINSLKAFAMNMFPTTTIEKVDDDNYKSFLAGYSDNRPRTLLFSRKASPSLLYLMTAYEFRDKMAFGFASFKSQVNTMRRHYDVDSTCLMVFKEDTEQYTARLESAMLQRDSMRDIIIENQYLYAPRLTSQQVFDDLCPVSPSKRTRRICVILFTQKGKHDDFRRTFSQVAINTSFFPEGSKFMYVFEETQTAFTNNIGIDFEQEKIPVALVWRRTKYKLNFDWLPGGWKLDDKDDNERRLGNYLLELSNFIIELSKTRQIETLRDENEPHWLVLLINSVWLNFKSYLNSAVQYVVSGRWDEVTMVICVFIAYVVTMAVMMTGYLSPKNKSAPEQSRMNEPPRRQHISVYSLNPESNDTLILTAPPGKMTLLIIVDEASKNELFVEAQNAIKYQINRMQGWQFSFLQVDQYSFWYEQLTNQRPGTLDVNNVIGNILAINAHRKYYCLYDAQTQMSAYRAAHKNVQVNPESVGFSDSDSGSDEETGRVSVRNLYAPLSMWMDRLYDGSISRINVNEWPTFDS